ncbi:trimeric intracellular cation channel family protein [Nitrospirillum sp. BR 11828]|uniref:trimeric intracellular cation channel family protein n=1 Tax=Nitrospirillum sp. BR 11828 TaxID=3104325 RepID=UPI002ACAB505|nr:TRIC cation channel family protein [Nitrospirillum sp. BR 11828]MDZ5647177.1 TRIC cation channel family protein [Nitrospirillum sp. BR 11828]
MGRKTDMVLAVADMAGTVLFAVEGAMAALRGGLDLFGVLVLSFATALGGGVLRDLLIGAAPPTALRDWRYPAMAFAAGGATFVGHAIVGQLPIGQSPVGWMTTLDAAGLSLFAVAGTEKALNRHIPPFSAVLMGTITGVGGGTLRDLLLAQVPAILRVDVYATAALLGAAVMTAAIRLGVAPRYAALLGGGACFVLRMVSVWRHWALPTAAGLAG